MKSKHQFIFKNSISTKLFKTVFGLYLFIAVGVTIGHMIFEYRYQKNNIQKDLQDVQKTFEHGLALDLWQLDGKSLQSTLEGMLEIPIIVGVKIQNAEDVTIAVAGTVSQNEIAGDLGLHVDLLGLSDETIDLKLGKRYDLNIFMHQFPLQYEYKNKIRDVGEATFYSNTSVILRRVKLGFLLLVVNAFLKTAALWIIFLYFSNHLLRNPLNRLTSATKEVSLDNLDSFEADIKIVDQNELKILEESFNRMIQNLHLSIQERKKSESDLKDAHDRFLTVMNSIDATIYVADMKTYKILFMNKYMINEFKKDMTGEICWRSFRGESGPCSHCNNEKLIDQDGNPTGVNIWQGRNPITKKWYINYDRAIKWTDGRLVRLQIATDITAQKKLEEDLRQAQKMESIGTLAGGIAHDFNNILFPIVGYSEMLLEDIPEESPYRESLKKIHSGSLRARDLVNQILTFSRQEANELKPIKVQSIIKDALKLMRSTIPTTIEIKSYIKSDCRKIQADPTQIHQIVMNLTTNASHAMEKTGGKLKVNFKEVELGEQDLADLEMKPGIYNCLIVADTGVGMDKELSDKIFEPFFTTKEKGKGTGMGLSVVHGIVKNMNGAIHVYSEPGKGTEFHVYLPLADTEKKVQKTDAGMSLQVGTEHILLVDDEKEILTMEKKVLTRLGYQVTSFTHSTEALKIFSKNPDEFDLVITDMTMPNLSGDKLSTELIKIRSDIPILLCTGFSETISEQKAASLGIRGFLFKPIVMKELAQKIRDVLG